MKIWKFIIILVMICLSSCGNNKALDKDKIEEIEEIPESETEVRKAVYKKISAEEAYELMQELMESEYILLDVRTDLEYEDEHIEGALLIPDFEITARAERELPDKNLLIFIYCRSGRRSENVANELIEMGYLNIYDMGGIISWPYETEND